MGAQKTTRRSEREPKKMYVLMAGTQWVMTYATLTEAQESAENGNTILEVSASWGVSSKLTFRKEQMGEYV